MNTQFGYPQILMSAFEGIVLQKPKNEKSDNRRSLEPQTHYENRL
jgi:hypothetical protein